MPHWSSADQRVDEDYEMDEITTTQEWGNEFKAQEKAAGEGPAWKLKVITTEAAGDDGDR